MGYHNRTASHKTCRRCGRHSFHRRLKHCAYCGFGATKTLRQPGPRKRHMPFNGTKSFCK